MRLPHSTYSIFLFYVSKPIKKYELVCKRLVDVTIAHTVQGIILFISEDLLGYPLFYRSYIPKSSTAERHFVLIMWKGICLDHGTLF